MAMVMVMARVMIVMMVMVVMMVNRVNMVMMVMMVVMVMMVMMVPRLSFGTPLTWTWTGGTATRWSVQDCKTAPVSPLPPPLPTPTLLWKEAA